MFIHCVYFWLKPGLDAASKARFVDGLQSLVDIETVRSGYFGTPAGTDRPIIDRSYDYALVCAFDHEEGHDAYQVHPIHDAFRDGCSTFWERVTIYDFIDGRGER